MTRILDKYKQLGFYKNYTFRCCVSGGDEKRFKAINTILLYYFHKYI